MLAGALQACCEAKNFVFTSGIYAGNRKQSWLAFRKRAGFIDDQCVDLLQRLKSLGVLDQDSGVRSAARCPP